MIGSIIIIINDRWSFQFHHHDDRWSVQFDHHDDRRTLVFIGGKCNVFWHYLDVFWHPPLWQDQSLTWFPAKQKTNDSKLLAASFYLLIFCSYIFLFFQATLKTWKIHSFIHLRLTSNGLLIVARPPRLSGYNQKNRVCVYYYQTRYQVINLPRTSTPPVWSTANRVIVEKKVEVFKWKICE